MSNLRKIFRVLISKQKKISKDIEQNLIIKKAEKQFHTLPELSNPFFIIGISGALHIMELSKKYIPKNIDTVLVLNGMDEWEQNWARMHFSCKAVITLDNQKMLPHSKVLDLLFDNYYAPFGILDYDCFVFNPDCFARMQDIKSNHILNSIFFHESPILGRVPQTFFLFFNSNLIRALKKEYKVSCDITDYRKKIHSKIRVKLSEIGLDQNHYPENIKDYFDTLILLISLGHANSYYCNYFDHYKKGPSKSADLFHVGGVANPNTTYGWWGVRGSYFWWRALEECQDIALQAHYYQKFGQRHSSTIFDPFPKFKNEVSQEFFDFVDRIVQKEI